MTRATSLLLAALLPATPSPAAGQGRPPAPAAPPSAPGDWPAPLRDAAGSRYSPLDQVNTGNVENLAEAWRFPTGIAGPHEGGPLVVGGVMYLHTPFPNRVVALDLAQGGRVLWRYDPPVGPAPPPTASRDIGSRGLAWHPSGLVFVAILPGDLAALDARTGREVWRVRNADSRLGATMSSAPLVAGDLVIVGMAGTEYGVRGYLTAYRAATGQLVWRGYSTGPDSDVLISGPANPNYPAQSGRDLGLASWPGTAWRTGGGTTDGWLTWDPELRLVYHGTGAPAPWSALLRPGDNKWTSSLVARDLATGQVRWAFQVTPGDAWGYGAEGENLLVDLPLGGGTVKALVHLGRNGFAYTLDRTTGRLLVMERAGPANWATVIDHASGVPGRDQRYLPSAGGRTRGICPATVGLKGSAPAAWAPPSGLLFAPLVNLCMDVSPAVPRYQPGQPYLGATWQLVPGPGPSRGRLVAWDPAVGAIRWEVGEPLPLLGGTLATAGGLVFYATADGWFKALDQSNGRERWRYRLPAPSVGSPISYLGPDGRQYVALLVGPGGWPVVESVAGIAGLDWRSRQPGLLLVFALPSGGG